MSLKNELLQDMKEAMKAKEAGHTADEFEGREKEVFEIYSRLNRINQHKMVPIPICDIPEELMK